MAEVTYVGRVLVFGPGLQGGAKAQDPPLRIERAGVGSYIDAGVFCITRSTISLNSSGVSRSFFSNDFASVSYTHLTLPTILRV